MPAPSDVLAYIDPGAGSFLLQLLVGGLVATVVVVRKSWRRVTGLFGRRPGGVPEPTAESGGSPAGSKPSDP